MNFGEIGYIERILEFCTESNHFWGYLGEYLGWQAEIFRIGVSYYLQQYFTTG